LPTSADDPPAEECFMNRVLAQMAAIAAASLACAAAHAQSSAGGPPAAGNGSTSGARNEQPTTQQGMPPGAGQEVGNKGAVPASGPLRKNPSTGSVPGTIPAERSPEGNKAETPTSSGSQSGSGSSR
jgi:hypothetical protein